MTSHDLTMISHDLPPAQDDVEHQAQIAKRLVVLLASDRSVTQVRAARALRDLAADQVNAASRCARVRAECPSIAIKRLECAGEQQHASRNLTAAPSFPSHALFACAHHGGSSLHSGRLTGGHPQRRCPLTSRQDALERRRRGAGGGESRLLPRHTPLPLPLPTHTLLQTPLASLPPPSHTPRQHPRPQPRALRKILRAFPQLTRAPCRARACRRAALSRRSR